LVFGLLHFNHVAELIGLAGLALTNDFRVRLENAQDLIGVLGDPLKHARLGLSDYLSHTPAHRFQNRPERLQPPCPPPTRKVLRFLQHSLVLIQNLSRSTQQFPTALHAPFLTLRSFQPSRQGDGHHLLVHTAHAVTNALLQSSASLLHLFHRPRQHACSIAQ